MCDHPVQARLNDQLAITRLLGRFPHLAAERKAFADGVRREDDATSAIERVRQYGRVPGSARELDRLPAQRVATIAPALVAERSGKPSQEPGAKLDVIVAQRCERGLEQRDEPLVASFPRRFSRRTPAPLAHARAVAAGAAR